MAHEKDLPGIEVPVLAYRQEWKDVLEAACQALVRLRFSNGDWDDVASAIEALRHIEQTAIEALEGAP